MAATVACIAGEEIYRQWETRRLAGTELGPRSTPFGQSSNIFLIDGGSPFYLLARYGPGLAKAAPCKVNYRANLYALRDLGVQCILAWGPAGTITHTIAVGDLVVLSDVIDMTSLRPRTFFEKSPLGFLRQFPVFCPNLRNLMGELLSSMKLVYHSSGVAAVCEGPRLETPAEVRMLGTMGADIVTHTFAPEMFLAKELQMCYAAVCYVVNYAETGSKHRPFAAGSLFGGLTQQTDSDRLAGAQGAISQIVRSVAAAAAGAGKICECDRTMEHHVREYNLPADWHKWFT